MKPVRAARRTTTAVAVLTVLLACGDEIGPPEIVLDQSACDRCGMLISEPRFAAAYRAGGRTAVFDDIGCLLEALDQEGLAPESTAAAEAEGRGQATAAEVWLLDREQQWIPAAEAVFVRSDALATPMGGGIQAVRDRAEAQRLAAGVGGSIVESLIELGASRRASLHRDDATTEESHDQ